MKDGKLYTGVTKDLKRRLDEHNRGKNAATKYRKPFVLIHSEAYETKNTACRREYYLKTPKGSLEKYQIWQQYELHQTEIAQLGERPE